MSKSKFTKQMNKELDRMKGKTHTVKKIMVDLKKKYHESTEITVDGVKMKVHNRYLIYTLNSEYASDRHKIYDLTKLKKGYV